jgi:hypothetical protein
MPWSTAAPSPQIRRWRLRHEHELVVAVLRQRGDKLARAVALSSTKMIPSRPWAARPEPLHQRGYVVASFCRYDDGQSGTVGRHASAEVRRGE